MMLERQIVPIQFAGGIDTKTDDKQVVPTKLLTLENGVFSSPKKIRCRNGYQALSQAIAQIARGYGGTTTLPAQSATITAGVNLAAIRDELIEFDGNQAYSYSQNSSKWTQLGDAHSVISKNNRSISISDDAFYTSDMAVFGNVGIKTGMLASLIESHLSLTDLVTGAEYQSTKLIPASPSSRYYQPRVAGLGSKGYLFVAEGNDDPYDFTGTLKAAIFDSTNLPDYPVFSTTIDTVASDATTAVSPFNYIPRGLYDFESFSDSGGGFVFFSTNAGTLTLRKLDANLVSTGSVSFSAQVGGPPSFSFLSALTVTRDAATGNIYVFWVWDAGLYYRVYDTNLNLILDSYQLVVTTSLGIVNLAAITYQSPNVIIAYEFTNNYYEGFDNPRLHAVFSQSVNLTGPISSNPMSIGISGNGLASKFFIVNGGVYINTVYESPLQSTYFTIKALTVVPIYKQYTVVAKMLDGNGGGLQWFGCLSGVSVMGQKAYWGNRVKAALIGGSGFAIAVCQQLLDFGDTDHQFSSVICDQALLVMGSVTSGYDSAATPFGSLVENNFFLFPETPTLTFTSGAGSLAPGNYLYYIVYVWEDHRGQIHRSAPSVPAGINTLTAGKVLVDIDYKGFVTNRPTDKLFVEIYRTETNATIPHLMRIVPFGTAAGNETTDFGGSLSATPILYTTGGILDNKAPPSASFGAVYKDRVFLGGLDDDCQLAYSKQVVSGEPIAFADELRIQVSRPGGAVGAIRAMDEKLIIFKKEKLFFMTGEGPDETGQNDNFSFPQEIVSPVGCQYPKSIVEIPEGLIFKSEKGFWLLDRSLQVSYIGAEVEAYNSQSVSSAVQLSSDQNQVRFTMSSGVALVYDYFMRQWSVFTNIAAQGACMFQGAYTFVKSNGAVFQESSGYFKDGPSTAIVLKIGTAWIRIGDLQGFQRVRRGEILGSFKSAHSLTLQIGFDYQSSYANTLNLTPDGLNPLQNRFHMPRQKCEAVRFLIQDSFSGTPGEGYDLSGLSLEIGIKRGLNKLSAAKTVG